MTTSYSDKQAELSAAKKEHALRNPWVLAIITVIVVFLAVNAYMIAQAVIHRPALVDKNYYEKGRDIERSITSRREKWQALAWTVDLQIPSPVFAGQRTGYVFTIEDGEGRPVSGAAVRLIAQRPVGATDSDVVVEMVEYEAGQYLADAVLTLPGLWDMVTEIDYEGDVYHQSRRIDVREAQ